MKRYVLLFSNGSLVQQDGLNLTYLQMHDLGLLKLIIDTQSGEAIFGSKWEWIKIQEYSDGSLINDKDKVINK